MQTIRFWSGMAACLLIFTAILQGISLISTPVVEGKNDRKQFIEIRNQPFYQQGGTGGSATAHNLGEEGLREGLASTRIEPSSKGHSLFRHQILDVEKFRGKHVVAWIWIKSRNTVVDAIQGDIQDGIGSVIVRSYSNSGLWQRIRLERYISPLSTKILLNANVKANADDGAYVNGAVIMIKPSSASVKVLNRILERWFYHQDGVGGTAEKHTYEDAPGKNSVRVEPSSEGNSFIRYELSDIEKLRGKDIAVWIWVKSRNTVADAIQIDFQDGIGSVIAKSYPNNGLWERIRVERYVDPLATMVLLTANVKASADDGAYFNQPVIGLRFK
jgi:hypothetical protein